MLRLCRWALFLYPHAWRARYEAELEALLELRRLSLGTLLDLLRGAFDAHLHPGAMSSSPRQRMRGTIAATLSCWVAVVLIGASFAKGTEDKPFRGVTPSHPAVGDARLLIVILGIASGLVVAVAGAPLAWCVVRQAWRERTPSLVRAIGAAAAGLALFASVTGCLAVLAHHGPIGALLGHALFVVYGGIAAAIAVVFAFAARAAVMTARFRGVQLVVGVGGAWLLARLLAAMTLAVVLYTVLLAIDAPGAAAQPNGPLSVSTTVMLASQAAGMTLASWVAAISARRGMRALRDH